MNSALRYDYNLPWRGVAVGVVFYGALSVLMAYLARDDSGVIFICLIALSAMFAVLAIIILTRRLVFPRVLELADDAILFPHGFPRTRITRIRYSDIIRMSETSFDDHRSLYMGTALGSFEIGAARLPDIESYHLVRDFTCSRATIVLPRQDVGYRSPWRIGGFPEPILGWVEPEAWPRYRTHLVVSKPWLPRLAKVLWFFVRCFGILILPWLLLCLLRLPTSPVAYFSLSTILTLFLTSLHWLNVTHPARATKITLRDNGITQLSGKQTRDLNYRDCLGWAVVERQFEGCTLHILLLQQRTYVVEVAMPDTTIRDRLVQIFHDKQIPQSSDLRPSWESRP